MRDIKLIILLLAVHTNLIAGSTVDDKFLANEGDVANWAGYGRTYSEQRFSPQTQINDKTVSELGIKMVSRSS